jgi:hypothetical protein
MRWEGAVSERSDADGYVGELELRRRLPSGDRRPSIQNARLVVAPPNTKSTDFHSWPKRHRGYQPVQGPKPTGPRIPSPLLRKL